MIVHTGLLLAKEGRSEAADYLACIILCLVVESRADGEQTSRLCT